MSKPEILSAMTTPFVGGRVDAAVLETQINHVAPHSDGVFLPGTTGEFVALTDDEYETIVKVAVDTIGADRVVAHVGAAGTGPSLKRLEFALGQGISRCSALTPFYFRVSADTILDYYQALAEAAGSSAEIYGYVFPDVTGNDLGPEHVTSLIDRGVAGVKTSGAASALVAEYCEAATGDFRVWSGNDADLPNILRSGGSGTVSGVSGVAPQLWARFRDAWDGGDEDGWKTAQAAIERLVALCGPSVARHKFGMECAGLPHTDVRMTMDVIPEAVQQQIHDVVAEVTAEA